MINTNFNLLYSLDANGELMAVVGQDPRVFFINMDPAKGFPPLGYIRRSSLHENILG